MGFRPRCPVSPRIGRTAAVLGTAGLLVGLLAGCGDGSSATTRTVDPAARATGVPSAGASGERRRQFDPAMQKKIAECLQAAGLPVPSFSPRPSGERRSGSFTGPRPSGSFAGPRPSGSPGFRGPYGDPKTRAALEACGIQLPTGRPSGAPGDGGQPGGPPPGDAP